MIKNDCTVQCTDDKDEKAVQFFGENYGHPVSSKIKYAKC